MSETQHPERIGIRELRQNPAGMVAGLKEGRTYVLTEYNRALATISPAAGAAAATVPARSSRPVDVSLFARHDLATAVSVDDLLDELKGEW